MSSMLVDVDVSLLLDYCMLVLLQSHCNNIHSTPHGLTGYELKQHLPNMVNI